MENTHWKVSWYIHESPIYEEWNWITELFVWDLVICKGGGFWSEDLEYCGIYEVKKNENNEFVFVDKNWKEVEKSWNVVPFMLKIVKEKFNF